MGFHGACPLTGRRHPVLRGRWVGWTLLLLSAVLLPATGDDGSPTASTTPFTSAMDGLHPSPLTAREEALPALQALVQRFNPAMALPDTDGPWPVDVAYTWSLGAPLMARTVGGTGRAGPGDVVAVAGARLGVTPWADLPQHDGDGHHLEYWIDGPGDDRVATPGGLTGWRERWRELAGVDPARSAFPPTQYAHVVWLDRAQGRLAIQYWFFFPFNEWINHHEGDWEHMDVILEGPGDLAAPAAAFHAIGHQFYFHGWRFRPPRTLRVSGDHGGDHPVVFTGGRGRWLSWGGSQSGGSYPLPARYAGAGGGLGPLRPADDTRRPRRFLGPDAFRVVLLPEPGRLDARAHPELSWLRLPFFAGAPRAHTNPPLTDLLGGGEPPMQPAQRRDWNSVARHPLWPGTPQLEGTGAELGLPGDWRLIGTTPDGSQVARR